jgi:hypothetical protein
VRGNRLRHAPSVARPPGAAIRSGPQPICGRARTRQPAPSATVTGPLTWRDGVR